MLKLSIFFVFISTFLIKNGSFNDSELQQDISFQLKNENGTVVSRKRRYLVFPAGSSFQLVFCLTYPSLGVGSYFVFGHTAALAWELPSTPLFYSIKDYEKKAEEEANAETTTMEIPHDIDLSSLGHDDQNDNHRISNDFVPFNSKYEYNNQKIDTGFSKWSVSNHNRQPVSTYNNPFKNFIKNSGYSTIKKPSWEGFGNIKKNNARSGSIGNTGDYGDTGKVYYGRVRGNNVQRSKYRDSPVTSHVDPMFYSIHRRTRRDLYKKIENFLIALNLDGKNCLLKAICEVTQSSNEKGNFLEEVIKAVFRIKPHENYPNEDTYDHAANATHNCVEMYPGCKGSVWNNLFLFQK